MQQLKIAIFGLSITSSWGNGHATTFRSLIKALHKRGHRVTFYERDVSWYANNRDMPEPPFCETRLYHDLYDLRQQLEPVADSDLVIIGSYVPEAEQLLEIVSEENPPCLAFYDIDTPVTLHKLQNDDYEYLSPAMIPRFDLYLSFTGGPILDELESRWQAQRARPLYCSVDPDLYYSEAGAEPPRYTMGYLGTYSDDRQPTLQELLLEPARLYNDGRFCVAGAQYPDGILWPDNVEHVEHIPPQDHCAFYNGQRFTLNVTRRNMIDAGFAPSVRLFEAGACGTPVISDYWHGLDSFFEFDREILVARNRQQCLEYLQMDESERRAIGQRMQQKVLRFHTADHRAMEIEEHWRELQQPALSAASN